MKKIYAFWILTLVAMLCSTAVFSQIIYVNAAATGANNGSSWTDAFQKLENALTVAKFGDVVWIAKGTYRPSGNPANGGFLVTSGVKIYGGFAGNEAKFEDRNISTNPTIITGDVAGDDIPFNFTQKRTDNALHTFTISGDAQYTTFIDGLNIRGGQTLTASTDPDLTRRGGGILALTPVEVMNCHFSDNFAVSGAGIACISAACSGSRIRSCVFEKNESTSQSAGIFFRELNSGEVSKCVFKDNITNRGCLYPNLSKSIVVDSCLFEGNDAGANFAAGMFTWQTSFQLKNSIFRNNKANNGAGMYNDGRDGISYFTIENCTFEGNSTLDYGGSAIYNWKTEGEISNCQFLNNTAPSTAGGIYNGSNADGGTNMIIKNCLFEGNSARFGAAVAGYSERTRMTYDNCIFKKNTSQTSGGALTNGFKAIATLKNCIFEENSARFGGAMFNQNDSTGLSINGCTFVGNGAEQYGGALNISSGIVAEVKNTVFSQNTAVNGGAVDVSEDSLDLTVLQMENVVFSDNYAQAQGAGINASNANVFLTNALFQANWNLGGGYGGAISNNASEGKTALVKATNCTFAKNEGFFGAGIAQWEDATSSAILVLQNSILMNVGANYEVEDGTPDVFSDGGNLSSDETLQSILINTNDLNSTDPQFVDLTNNNFQLKISSPCIDKGMWNNTPFTDLLGKPRINAPDMGCYENQDVVSAKHPILKTQVLQISPNPASDFVQTSLDAGFSGKINAQIFSASGMRVKTFEGFKQPDTQQIRWQIEDLPAGAYFMRIQVGEQLFSGSFLKN